MLALGRELGVGYVEWVRSEAEVAEFAAHAVHAVNPWIVRRDHELELLERHANPFLALATDWLAGQADHPWEAPLGTRSQLWVGPSNATPSAACFESPSGYIGHGYFRPRAGGLWTTTAIDGWPFEWFLQLCFMHGTEVGVWELAVRPGARVYEVRSGDDLAALVRRYPALREGTPLEETPDWTVPAPLYLPDWELLARDWDGLRVTMGGKLRCVCLPLPVHDGYTILIDELGYEETLWLNWTLEPVGQIGSAVT